MTLNPDRLLMEHVFHPLVEQMDSRIGNFILARLCYIAAAVFELAILVLALRLDQNSPAFWLQTLSSIAVGGMIVMLNRATYVLQDVARRGFAADPFLLPLVVARVAFLLVLLACLIALLLLPFLRNSGMAFAVLVIVALGCGTYFAHCTLPPRVRPAIHRFRMARRARFA